MDRAIFFLGLSVLWFVFAGYAAMVADWKSGRAIAAVIAVVFGLYNLLRFLLERRRFERHEAPTEPRAYESRNPDFDFDVREKELDKRTGQGPYASLPSLEGLARDLLRQAVSGQLSPTPPGEGEDKIG